MEFKDCTVGTKVHLGGEIVDISNDKKAVLIKWENGKEFYIGIDLLERDFNQYDPKRKFRKGDIVKPDYKGRKWEGMLPEGEEYEVLEDEDDEGLVLIKIDKSIDPTGEGIVSFSRLVLIKPVEEIEKNNLYYIEESEISFDVLRKGIEKDVLVYSISLGNGNGVSRDEAKKKAEELCDEKNRIWQEWLRQARKNSRVSGN
ncbi:hypothetical protein [Akkermansia muciniphila]|uniref:hypothetical protein n=1 Tax=Akkermansia muciniphila TaxID=239935 RepID=UPI000C9D2493|nr:hypothetical protein [Akkermansia muciniphila]PNC89834.1 hypothetical protein CXT91_09795 [Akkermansia muciniphila]